jgi:hypothetical protein
MRWHDDFFIGYAPAPRRTLRFLKGSVAAMLVVSVVVAAVTAWAQRDPGDGQWSAEPDQYVGVLVVRPYPMLHLDDGTGTLLLVGEGKIAASLPAGADGTVQVRGRGRLIHRGSLRMLELAGPLDIMGAAGSVPTTPIDSEPLAFRGEIIDTKCFAGAMKPGTGKAHKSCAILCLRGGIPPALSCDDGKVLLIAGVSVEGLVPLAGETVTAVGRRSSIGAVQILEVTDLRLAASD